MFYQTPLALAIQQGKIETVNSLLSANVNFSQLDLEAAFSQVRATPTSAPRGDLEMLKKQEKDRKIAEEHTRSIPKQLIEKFKRHIKDIRDKAFDLDYRSYGLEADALRSIATKLEDKGREFFAKSLHEQKEQFEAFKSECTDLLFPPKIKKDDHFINQHRGCKQSVINFLQTISVIGAFIGVCVWYCVGRYTLFPVKTATATIFDDTDACLRQMKHQLSADMMPI